VLTQDGCNEDAERDSVGQVGDTRQPGLDSSAVHRCSQPQVWRQGEDKPFHQGFILASLYNCSGYGFGGSVQIGLLDPDP